MVEVCAIIILCAHSVHVQQLLSQIVVMTIAHVKDALESQYLLHLNTVYLLSLQPNHIIVV